MFLFFNDPEEDFSYMMEGYRSGIITEERLEDALRRILGIKAYLGLHKKNKKSLHFIYQIDALTRKNEHNKSPCIYRRGNEVLPKIAIRQSRAENRNRIHIPPYAGR